MLNRWRVQLAMAVCGWVALSAGCMKVSKEVATSRPSSIIPIPVASVSPLMAVLGQFSAADVPTSGPAEIAVAPLKPSTAPVPTDLPGKGLAQHPMLYIGEGYNKIFVVNDGKVIWTYSTGPGPEYDDAWMLSNGNILFSRMQYVAEITPKKQVVWRYDATDDKSDPTRHTEIHTCQPIGLDKVMFVENGLPPKLKVINIKTGAVEVDHVLDYPQPASPKNIHGEFRRARYTAQGTYLVSYQNMGKVVEYDKDFNEIWRFDGDSLAAQHSATVAENTTTTLPATKPAYSSRFIPWAAVRLKNGNTLITIERDKAQIEVSPDKKIVWELKPENLPMPYRYKSTQTCTRLANGNTIVCSRSAPQLVEVTPDKQVVWVLNNTTDVGPATAVQILDEPVIPENTGESER